MTKAALRQQRWRQRRARGLRRLQIDVSEDQFSAAMIAARRLTADEVDDPEAMSRAAADLLGEWSEAWLDHAAARR